MADASATETGMDRGSESGAGLGKNGTGRAAPITEHVGVLHAREEGEGGVAPGCGVALLSELLRLEHSCHSIDWKKGSRDCAKWEDLTAYFDRAGTLDDHKKPTAAAVSTHKTPVHLTYVGGRAMRALTSRGENIEVEHASTGQRVRCASMRDVQKLKGIWAAEDRLDKYSTCPEHFFACSKFCEHHTKWPDEAKHESFASLAEAEGAAADTRVLARNPDTPLSSCCRSSPLPTPLRAQPRSIRCAWRRLGRCPRARWRLVQAVTSKGSSRSCLGGQCTCSVLFPFLSKPVGSALTAGCKTNI